MLVRASHGLTMQGVMVSSLGVHCSCTAHNTHPVNIFFLDCIHSDSHMQPGDYCLRPQRPPGHMTRTHRRGLGMRPTKSILSESEKSGAER